MLSNESIYNLFIIGLVFLICYFRNYFKAVYLALKLRGPPVVPILGNVLLFQENDKLLEIGLKCSQLYGSVVRFWIGILPVFCVVEPEHLQLILGSSKKNQKSLFYTFLHNIVGDGLITASGEKWKFHRRLVQPYFNINTLKIHFHAIHKFSVAMAREMDGKKDLNIVEISNQFVFNVMQSAVMGLQVDEDCPYRKGKLLVTYRLSKPWLLLDSIFKVTNLSKEEKTHHFAIKAYTKKILDMKQQNQTVKNTPLNNLIDMLMEISRNNPEFTEKDIIDEASTFVLAGQDSVAVAVTFSLYFLAKHQDCQAKVLDEINAIFKGEDRETTFEDISEMKYLEQCLKETLRLCPSIPMISRTLTEDLALGKVTLPTGANIVISPFITHRLPHFFPEPLKFDPDRFTPENKAKMHPYAYIPFSAGPRNCIGYKFALIQLKTVVTEILRKYHISLTPGYEELNFCYKVTLKVRRGIWLRLSKRD